MLKFAPVITERKKPDTNHRQFDRAFLTVAVTIETGNRIIHGAECRNISMGGMMVYTEEDIPEGAQGTVTLTKKCDSRRYSFSADFEVVRKEIHKIYGPGLAINFLRLFDEDLAALAYIVEYHLALTYREKLIISEEKLEGIRFKIAQTRDELEQAFSIVHDMYVQEGYMEPQPHGMRLSFHHSLPFTTTFIGVLNGEVITASTLFLDSIFGLPMDALYINELKALRNNHRLIAEIGAFAVKPGYKNTNSNLVVHLQKMIINYALRYFSLDDLVLTVNPKHRMYYEYIMLCEQIGKEVDYEHVNGNPAIAMVLNLRTVEKKFKESFCNFPSEQNLHQFIFKNESKNIDWPPLCAPIIVWNHDLLRYFFEEKTDLFSTTDKKIVGEILKFYN